MVGVLGAVGLFPYVICLSIFNWLSIYFYLLSCLYCSFSFPFIDFCCAWFKTEIKDKWKETQKERG